MEVNKMARLREELEGLTTEQLDARLRQELHREKIDDDAVRTVMALLKEREKGRPAALTPEMERAWEDFCRERAEIKGRADRARSIRRWSLRVASAAAVVCLLMVAFPMEARAQTFWQRLFHWSESIVEFFGPRDDDARVVEYAFDTDNPGLQQVYDAVVQMGITEPVVPMWLPEGYELVECKTETSPRRMGTYSRFSDGNKEAVLEVNAHFEEKAHVYHKDDREYTEYEQNGYTFFITSNNEIWTAIWMKDNIECSLFVDCQEDVLTEILRSIYKRRTTE